MNTFSLDWFQYFTDIVCKENHLPQTNVDVVLDGARADLTFTCGDEVYRLHNVHCSEQQFNQDAIRIAVTEWHKEI